MAAKANVTIAGSTPTDITAIALDTLASPTDVTTSNVTSTAHGLAPKAPADATKFLNGAATPAFAQVKDSDLATTDITTNDASSSKHGLMPKLSADATKFFAGDGTQVIPKSRRDLRMLALGLIDETFDSGAIAGVTATGATGATNVMLGGAVYLRKGEVVTNLVLFNAAVGSSVTLVKLGLYKADGTFVGRTADVKASLPGNNYLQAAIAGGAVTIAADGLYYVTLLSVAATTQPTFARGVSVTGTGIAIGSGSFHAVQVTGLSDIAASNATFAASSTLMWLGVS